MARRHRGALRRHGLLLGRRADLLEAARRRDDRGRLHGWLHPEPDLRGDLHRAHRPRRDRARGVRPHGHLPRAAAQGVLGEPRPHHAQPAGQRHRHGLPVGDLLDHRRAGGRRAHHAGDLPGRAHRRRSRRDHHRPRVRRARRGRSTTPRTTTSSTCTRTPTATATTAPTGSPARSASRTSRPRPTCSRPPDLAMVRTWLPGRPLPHSWPMRAVRLRMPARRRMPSPRHPPWVPAARCRAVGRRRTAAARRTRRRAAGPR